MNRAERLNDPEETLRLAQEGHQAQVWTALPGVVQAVDLVAQTVSVQPSIQATVTGAGGKVQLVDLPLLVDVPLVWPRCGRFALTFPVQAGAEVLLVFASRAVDSWWQSGGTANAPVEPRMHDLSDAFAILAPTSQAAKLVDVSPDAVQLRDVAGTTRVEITPDGKVNVVAVAEVNVTAPTITATGDTTVDGNLTVTGDLVVTGESTLGGIVFSTHVHGSSPGPSNP